MKLLALIFALVVSSQALAADVAHLRYTPDFILQQVLLIKNWQLRPEIPFPEIRFASQVSLQEFQDDVEPQWHMRPSAITNAFILQLNRIYLLDDADYYKKLGRCMDDSLAHELTHYLQTKYRGWDIDDDSLEMDAIEVQNQFREKFCPPARR